MNLDDLFRLYLMDTPVEQHRMLDAREFIKAETGITIHAPQLAELWGRYKGFDGRTSPTHDYNTGERIRH